MEHKLGLVKSPEDKRDYLLKSFFPVEVSVPEEWLFWQTYVTAIKYQSSLGSCASFAGDGQKECFDYRELGVPVDLSEQFLYGECKKIDGMPNVEGTFLRAVLSVLKNLGCCEESYFPYEGKYPPDGTPKTGYLENAAKYKISSYASVEVTKEGMQHALYVNGPVIVGVMVYESFVNTGGDGIVQFPSGKQLGGHALLVIGYNKLGLVCKNSWSTRWGNKGYCTIPWAVWEQINLGEAWSIVDVVQEKKPWIDWPESELELAWLTKNSGVLQGYSATEFKPWSNVTMHQAITIATRLGFPVPKDEKEYWSTPALRGWIHENWPQYTFLEERWEETITRYQFALIIGRYLKAKSLGTIMV